MPRKIAWLALPLALGVLLVQAAPPALGGPPNECKRELAGPATAYLGGWIPAALDDPRVPRERDPLGQFEALAGKRVTVVNRWEHWGLGPGGRVDIKWLRRVVASGAFPMVTWGTWYPWGKHQNSPEEYIAAWRHVHEIFTQKGAGQVSWVWNPSEKNHPESLGLWYPGDDVVDWIAVDGYNWDDPNYWKDASGDTWRTLDMVFTPSFDDIAAFAPADKPWMIAETASTERRGDPGRKASWICDAFRRAIPEQFPRVKAVLWFE